MTDLLLQTKFFKPTLRPSLVIRPQLIAQLNASLGLGAKGFAARLTLVSAPAGFGKTTLVSAWLAQLASVDLQYSGENVVAWLSLDESDNDPVRFLAYLIAALQTAVPDIGQSAVHFLQSPQPPAAETILTLLINDISQSGRPVILVLDDYHVVTNPALHQALTFLLEHLPPQLHLLITTRSDPPLPLSRLRVRGQIVEIRQNDLRFTIDEARTFFNQVMGLDLSNEEMVALEQRTEGWIAGLQLAALSLENRVDREARIVALTGGHHFIIDYLTEEVLSQQSSSVREFLLFTSILERVCGPLADALMQSTTGQETLEYLEHSNLFLFPLDDDRRWFRYHHLFAEVLRQRLQRTQPGEISKLHNRAQRWFECNGLMHEAVNHALAGGEFEQAAQLIEGVAGSMLRRGSISTLIRWLDALPEEVVHARPRLCLARGWIFLWGPAIRLESVDKWVQLALQTAKASNLLNSELAGEIAALQAITATVRGDTAQSREISEQALKKLAMDNPWRSVVAFSLGAAYHFSGDTLAASRLLGEAMQLSQVNGALYLQLISASFLAHIEVHQGRLDWAMEMYQQVLEWAGHGIPHKGALMAHGGLAEILCERNQLEAALAHIQIGCAQLELTGGSWVAFLLYRNLARVRLGQGNWQDALQALDLAYQGGQRNKVSYVVTQSAAMRAKLHLAQGDLRAAEVWAANSGLNPDNPENHSPGYRYVEYITLACVFNAQGRHADALSLLERLLNSVKSEERVGDVIAILALQSLVFQAQGDTVRTFKRLEQALTLAEPQDYIRVFVDEGEPMRALLSSYRSQLLTQLSATPDDRSRRLLIYSNKLLAAFTQPGTPAPPQIDPLIDALTARELEVLHLIATGASNREIADELFLAVPTVKKHVSNIMSKLNAASRTQAVAEARALELL